MGYALCGFLEGAYSIAISACKAVAVVVVRGLMCKRQGS